MSVSKIPARVGVLLPTREFAVTEREDPTALLELAQLAESLGYDSVWAGDSPVARPRFEPLSLLSAVAARTERVQLGTAVLLAALRSAVLLAQQVASLDQLSRGRLILGLGAGFPIPQTQAEFEAVGVPFKGRIRRLEETVAICRRLWSTQTPDGRGVSFSGRYWSFEALSPWPRPYQPAGPPLWLAGAGEQALSRVGRLFDGWLPYPPTAEQFALGLDVVHQAMTAASRDPSEVTPAVYLTINIDDDAERKLEHYVQAYYGLPLEGMRYLQGFYAGDAGGCEQWLRGYVEAGATHIVLRFGTLDDPSPMVQKAAGTLLRGLQAKAAL